MSRSASTEPLPNQSPIPSILVRSASPRGPEQSLTSSLAHNPHLPETPPSSTLQVPKRINRKRTCSEADLSTSENVPRKIMAPRSSKKEGESSSKKLSASSSVSKTKSKSKPTTDDWTEVTEPEERRRIQNKLAQRKFREKNRESKERAERDARNQQHAGSCYQVPAPSDVSSEHEVSGLPWGTFSMRHVVSRGHEAESRRSSGRDDYLREDGRYQPTPFAENMPYSAGAPSYQQHGGSFGGSSTGEDGYYETDPQLFYDYGSSGIPTHQQQYPPPPQQGHFVTDQFHATAWPESPAFAPILPPSLPLSSPEIQQIYY